MCTGSGFRVSLSWVSPPTGIDGYTYFPLHFSPSSLSLDFLKTHYFPTTPFSPPLVEIPSNSGFQYTNILILLLQLLQFVPFPLNIWQGGSCHKGKKRSFSSHPLPCQDFLVSTVRCKKMTIKPISPAPSSFLSCYPRCSPAPKSVFPNPNAPVWSVSATGNIQAQDFGNSYWKLLFF